MLKIYISVAFVCLSGLANAYNSIDSIGLENINGKKVILHRIEKSETYYALGRRYQIDYKNIIRFNENKSLRSGVIIKIPTEIPFGDVVSVAQRNPSSSTQNTNTTPQYTYRTTKKDKIVQHKVKSGESLFSLARKYETTELKIKKYNKLKTSKLKIGQILHFKTTETVRVKVRVPNSNVDDTAIPDQNNIIKHNNVPRSIAHNPAPVPVQVPTQNNTQKPVQNTIQNTVQNSAQNSSKSIATNNTNVNSSPKDSNIVTNVAVKSATPENTKPSTSSPKKKVLTHIVNSNETLYSIATKYNTTMNELSRDNNIKNYQIQVGSTLYVNGNANDFQQQKNAVSENVVDKTNHGDITIVDPKLRRDPSVYGLSQVEEKGSAMWIDDKDLDKTKMLVLHKSAPIGTIIRITNPMNNRSTFAKVVGSFSDSESTKNVIVLMTKAVASSIGAMDKKFYCNINYGMPNEDEQSN